MDLGLRDVAVLVSGGAAGIGEACVRAFAAEGARVAFLDRDITAGEALAAHVPDTRFIPVELMDPGACETAARAALVWLGGLGVLVNNAGANDAVPLTATTEAFRASLDRNLVPAFVLLRETRSALIAARGCVVNVGSKVAETGQGRTSGYAAAKGALHALTREWAVALAPEGVRVNAVVPAECDTRQYREWFGRQPDPAAAQRRVAGLVPLEHRLTRPDEIADAILFLSSRRAGHITGQWLHVDGGYTHLDRAVSASGDGW
jgi:L-fucose dehydrogenase